MVEILQPDHPMLRGLRFFGVVDNVASVQNLAGRGGGSGVVSGGPTISNLGKGFKALVGDATDNIVTFSANNLYGNSDSRDVTMICRCKANSQHIGGVVSVRNASLNGWYLLFSNSGGSETGYNFAVFGGSSKFQEAQDGLGSAAQNGVDVVVAGKYVHADRQVYLYTRQPTDKIAILRNSRTNTNSGSPTTEDWDIRSSETLFWLKETHATPDHFNGELAWVAIFDRALSNDEIAQWSRDEEWPFAEDYPLTSSFTARMYATGLTVSGSGGYSQEGGERGLANEIDAAVVMTGDLTNQGSGSQTRTFRNTLEARQQFYYGIPLLKRFRTVVSVESDVTPATTRSFRTRVGVRSSPNPYLDGRRDLLFTGGYRR